MENIQILADENLGCFWASKLAFWCTADVFLLFPNVQRRQAWCQRQRPCKTSMDVASLVQAASFFDKYSYPPEIPHVYVGCKLGWRPWWLAWSNTALNLHWRAMAVCWMLVQRRNLLLLQRYDTWHRKCLMTFSMNIWHVEKTTFQHCATYIELQWLLKLDQTGDVGMLSCPGRRSWHESMSLCNGVWVAGEWCGISDASTSENGADATLCQPSLLQHGNSQATWGNISYRHRHTSTSLIKQFLEHSAHHDPSLCKG